MNQGNTVMRSPTKLKISKTLTVLCAVLAFPVMAQDSVVEPEDAAARRYAVEIILFRYGPGVPTGNERFLPDPPPDLIDEEFGSDLAQGAIPEFGDSRSQTAAVADRQSELDEIALPAIDVEMQLTPRDDLQLQKVYDKLELLDAYEPVFWSGWTQTAIAPARSPEIPLRRLGNAPAEFDGTLKLYLSRFLHLVVNVALTERGTVPADYRGPAELPASPVKLRIDEDRIMKNGDIRYYDHPKFGLLAKVTLVEEAGDTEELVDDVLLPAAR
ncbi:MAG: hypothetical protein HKN35_14355 [Woeseia sp.]|nr:hypothetical protein [Woeseia sp.]